MTPLWLIAALTHLCFVQSQSSCNTPDGKSGNCTSIFHCASIRTMANKPGKSQDEINFLKSSKCGSHSGFPKVCCPDKAPPKTCFTTENNPGKCTHIFNCAHIRKRLESPTVTQQEKDYVNSLRCDGPGFSVCCGPPVSSVPVVSPFPPVSSVPDVSPLPLISSVTGNVCTSSATPPDPTTECCGTNGSPNKITNGNATGIDEYPWLALIQYKNSMQMFGGALISGRYVITASHCVSTRVVEKYGAPTHIRLGEYDISNSGRDCVPVEGGEEGVEECTLDPVVVPIERVILHSDYNPPGSPKKNDIALIRLTRVVEYTDFIRPICLPTKDNTVSFEQNQKLFVAGWGALNEKIQRSNLKQHVDVTYKNLQVCQQAYSSSYGRGQKLWNSQICAGGEDGKDSCKGDSGGPLMFTSGSIYEIVGIVSFGSTPCGIENVPGVYTKVFEYLTWINSNIQP